MQVCPKGFTQFYIRELDKNILDKTKQSLDFLLALHRNMSGWKRLTLYGLFQPDLFLCKVSNKPNS